MITTVTFEQAKLLKEKGFDEPCRFVHDNFDNIEDWVDIDGTMHKNSDKNASVYYSAPTIAEIICWLYEKHNIWIWVEKYEVDTTFIPQIPKANLQKVLGYYNSPTEAYSKAIEYTLTNLI